MQLKPGTQVVTVEGKDVGTIDRVVLKPDTKEVTHIVVRKGFLFTEDKVVPISLVGPATADQVMLCQDAQEMENLPHFEESYYLPAETDVNDPQTASDQDRSLYWYPPIAGQYGENIYSSYGASGAPRYILQKERNIPDGTVPIRESARVLSSDGKDVGDIERIFTDASAGYATHLLISEGLLLKKKKLIPTAWLGSVDEDEVHLLVDSHYLETLPEYQLDE